MSAVTSIYTGIRPVWERRLLRAIELSLTEAAKSQDNPNDYLHSAFDTFEADGWESALRLTLPHVPEQFQHLWTQSRARALMQDAFLIPTMKVDRQSRGRFMREAMIPALEKAGYSVEVLS